MIEIDPETGYYDIVDYAAVDDCGKRINPQIVEGQVMGATAQALGAAVHEQFVYDEDGKLLTPNFYDYHVPHALDMPPLRTGRSRARLPSRHSARRGWAKAAAPVFTPICAAVQDALRGHGDAIVWDSSNPTTGCGRCSRTRPRPADASPWWNA